MSLRVALLFVAATMLTTCGQNEAVDDHGHAHGAEVNVTGWTTHAEVFMSYTVPMTGSKKEFTVHMTELATFAPIGEGTVVLYTTGPDGKRRGAASDSCIRPGIYKLRLNFPVGGSYSMQLVYRNGALSDTCGLPNVDVTDSHDSAAGPSPEQEESEIVFLKEQQWETDFSTGQVSMRELSPSVAASADIDAFPGSVVHVSAPVNGTILAKYNTQIPNPGTWVQRGTQLAVLSADPGNAQGLAQIRAEYLSAKSDAERTQRLFEKGAVSAKRLEDARNRFEAARAGYELLESSDTWTTPEEGALLRITAPVSGYIEQISFRPGEFVSSGRTLYVLADPKRLLLSVHVPVSQVSALESITDARFRVEGFPEVYRISTLNGKLLARGNVIDAPTRTLRVTFEFTNPGGAFSIGMFAEAWVETGGMSDGILTIPIRAVMDETEGVNSVFVQRGGESFERRTVTLGRRGEHYVEILGGLQAGERIVTSGTYQIHLTSLASSVPEHGHTH